MALILYQPIEDQTDKKLNRCLVTVAAVAVVGENKPGECWSVSGRLTKKSHRRCLSHAGDEGARCYLPSHPVISSSYITPKQAITAVRGTFFLMS